MENKKIKLVELPDEMRIEQEKQEIEKLKQQEFLNPLLDSYFETIRNRVLEGLHMGADIETYIRTNTIDKAKKITCSCLRNLTTEVDEDNCVNTVDFLEQAFYLHCAVELEYKKQQELEELPTTFATELEELKDE